MKQRRYNLMILGQEAIDKLDSLPERGKGTYVSDAIAEKIKKDAETQGSDASKNGLESLMRSIAKEEIEAFRNNNLSTLG